ncbi:3-deoxy-D-manno-octulosonic-acid transferase [Comamonas sp. 26]|nr:3-deoxy-D-manno-octulosonic-acid transferase [Comamonas sp. 26]
MTLARALFSALAWAAQPLLRRKLHRRSLAEPGYAEAMPERFGHYQPPTLGQDGRGLWVWIHAVSLGEARAAGILVKALREQMPDMRLLLTQSTATGRAEGQKLLREGDVQVWLPWDTLGATSRFIEQFRPAVGVLMETEIWPNLIAGCANAGIPLALANARLNAKSEAGALKLKSLSRAAYGALAAVWAQTEGDARRLRNVGAHVSAVLGNLKFDVQPDALQMAHAAQWRAALPKPVLLFASSREGEEALFLDALKSLADKAGAVQWLIVPRHPQRFDEVAQLLSDKGFAVSRRSQWQELPPLPDGAIWLGDSLGEMALYYGLSSAALMGGSFAPLGGQNLIEALACGCPVLLGPHTFNFSQASEEAVKAGAALRVANMNSALSEAMALVSNPERLNAARQSGKQMMQGNRGAAGATARAVIELMKAPE